jgi:hypothetical protein
MNAGQSLRLPETVRSFICIEKSAPAFPAFRVFHLGYNSAEEAAMQFIAEQPWAMYVFLCLTLGLAPYNPPHLWEKLVMLKSGTLRRPVDWFDLFMHATPWVLLFLKWTTT